MEDLIRLVICQLECHPAFYRDRHAFLEEPFVTNSYSSSLSYLGGLGIPITDLQDFIRKQYIEWHTKRLKGLLTHPLLNDNIPSILVFPEGSIPVNCLEILYDFAGKRNVTVVAGSHTILETIEAKQIYAALGKQDQLGKRHKYNHDVTFVFAGEKIHHQKKQGVSPYDRIDTTALATRKITVHPLPIPSGNSTLKLVPLVCADALQLPNIQGDYDIVSIVSYDQKHSHFDSFINTQIGNSKIVLYCNDGRNGGSSIKFPLDNRTTSWFFESSIKGKLPKGDALLIIDMPTNDFSPQMGVMSPKPQMMIRLFTSISYTESALNDQDVSNELVEIKNISNNNARNSRLESLLRKRNCNPNQKCRVEHLLDLSKKGVDSEELWDVYGSDFVLDMPSIADIESLFSSECKEKLLEQFIVGDLKPENASSLQLFLQSCKSKISNEAKISTPHLNKLIREKDASIDREDEVARLLEFFDSQNIFVIEISGLPQIGKSEIVRKAIMRTNVDKINKIRLLNTSSAEYIICGIKGVGKDYICEIDTDVDLQAKLKDALENWDVVWFENCQDLMISGKWKSPEIDKLMMTIISIANDIEVKIIFESMFGLPLNLHDPSSIQKMRITGLEGKLIKHGSAILDRQLRRLEQKPNDIPDEEKRWLINNLGGHPLAIIFCADAIYNEGLTDVKEAIKRGSGFYLKVTDSILSVVTLTENDKEILRLLSGCRIEAPRDAIASTCNFPAAQYISNLCRQCLIEIISPTTIRLPGILRKRFKFSDLNETTRNLLHENAAQIYSQMAAQHANRIDFAVEAEFHASAIGQSPKKATGLIDGRVAAAKQFYDTHNFRAARKMLDPLISPNTPVDIIRLSALIDAQLGDLDNALSKAEIILVKNPSDHYFFFVLGKTVLTQSRPELGDKLVLIGRKAGVIETKISLFEGRIALRRRDFETAEKCFKQSISSTRTDPWAYFYLGQTYIKMSELSDAIDVLYAGDKYLSDNPRIQGGVKNAIRTKLGIAYVLNGDLEPASQILENCRIQEPHHPETLYASWLLKVRQEGVEKASEAFESFKTAKPKRWEMGTYHLYYGLFLKALDKIAEANDHFEAAHKYEFSNVYIMTQYADSLYTLALKAKREFSSELSKSLAIRCAKIVKKIFEFDSDNPFAEDFQIELYSEFGIQLSELED